MPTRIRDGTPLPRGRRGTRAHSPGSGASSVQTPRPRAAAPLDDGRATLDLLAALERQYQDQDTAIDAGRHDRLMDEPVALPDEYRLVDGEVHDPTIADELERVVPMFTLNDPELVVTPAPRAGESGQANATLREHWTRAVLRAAGTPEHGMPTLQAAVDACAADGGAITKLVFKTDTYAGRYGLRERDYSDDDGYPLKQGAKSGAAKYKDAVEAAKREAGVPFRWIACDVRGVYPLIRDGRIVECLEVQQRPLYDCLRQYGLAVSEEGALVRATGDPVSATELDTGSGGNPTCRFVEHWTDTHCSYVVEYTHTRGRQSTTSSAQVRTWRHGYGRVPYFTALGRTMAWWHNRKVGWGITRSKAPLVRYMSWLMTLHLNVAARDSLPPMYEAVPDGALPLLGEDGKPIRSEKWRPGEIRIGPPGGNLSVPTFPNSSANLEKHMALIDARITRMDSPRAPANLGDAENGFAENLMLSEGKIKHDPIGQSVERMLEQVTKFLWHLMRAKVREAVWVEAGPDAEEGWLSAGPDDLGPGVRVRWTLNAERPNARLVEARYWHERVRERTAGRHQAIEALGDNPDEVDEDVAMDEIRATPHYRALLLKKIFEKVGRGDLLAQAAAQQMAATGQVPGAPPFAGPMGALGGAPPGTPAPGGGPPAMGNGQVPDMGALAASPNGAGAAPMNGSVPGQPGTAGPPMRSAAPGVQSLGR